MRPVTLVVPVATAMILAIASVGSTVREPERRRGPDELARFVGGTSEETRGARVLARAGAESPTRATLSVPPRIDGPETAPVQDLDGATRIGANDLARLLDATKFWRADVRKLVLRTHGHRILLTVDNPFVLVDDRTVRLPAPVRSSFGELHVPVALLDQLPRDSSIARLYYDPRRRNVLQVPPSGLVGTPALSTEAGTTRVVFEADRTEEVAVLSRSRAHFLVHFGGVFVGGLPDSLPGSSLVRSIRPVSSATGTGFELAVSPEAAGFRVTRDPEGRRVVLLFTTSADHGVESFAPEGPPGPRLVKVVALDPGHGGTDAGVTAGGVTEKDLTLGLAKLVRAELTRRLAARVVLIREEDKSLTEDQRAEAANRVHADLVISLHFDGVATSRARGATAYFPPAVFPENGSIQDEGGAGLDVVPWRDVATRHAVMSRELAERVLAALDLRAQGPTRLRELLPYTLLGVNAPGILLECATLTSDADRQRLTRGGGLSELATAIVDGIEAFQATRR